MLLQTKVYQVIQRHQLIASGQTVVVGVSGGTDSLALLHLLIALRERLSFRIHVATLDHGLRGAAGADDALYVETLCAAWGVPCTRGFADVPALMRAAKLGIEAAARQARYGFLAQVTSNQGAACVAVAHHADDQAETVLLHLLRGSGGRGLSGMSIRAPLPDHPDLLLIRPLLHAARAEIEAYCVEQDIKPRHDATNDDTDYTRNKVRVEVLPLLRTINPQISRVLVQLADILSSEDQYMQNELETLIDEHVWQRARRWHVAREVFESMPVALRRRLILWAAGEFEAEIGYEQVIHVLDILEGGETGAIALLPKKLRFRVDYEEIVVEHADDPRPQLTALITEEHTVMLPGHVPLDAEWALVAAAHEQGEVQARLSVPLSSVVRLRPRRRGDRFAPLGMGGHTQKLSEWMIDHKVPQSIRDRIPLLTIDGEIAAILWGSQWAISAPYAVQRTSERIVYMRLEKHKDHHEK